ncbi:MAG: DUF2129 domain-containing protein [Candidatus Izemoplasmatales bacterium]
MVKRKGIIIYFQNKKAIKDIERFHVRVTYVNEKAGYAVAYMDEPYVEKTKKQIQNLKGIKKVEESLVEMEHLEFNE